ncbi:MAG: MAE_28990/MAE_18760 family HEPN-like nuclease [Colwellia sp.]
MLEIIEDFESRVIEVELYFNFIEQTSKLNASITDLAEDCAVPIKIDSDLKKILKANLFLLLYNLIESSFTKALNRLIKDINDSKNTYGMLIPEIRKIWLQDETKFFNKKTPNVNGKTENKLDYYFPIIDNLLDHILQIPENEKISGNLDAQNIRAFTAKYGILSHSINTAKSKRLYNVKEKRNELSHGNISFLECGRAETPSSLKEIKDEVISFMRAVLCEFETKIEQQYYKRA